MDITPNNKSRLLYQRGDRLTSGVIDLRRFRSGKKNKGIKTIKNGNKIISEILRKRKMRIGNESAYISRFLSKKNTVSSESFQIQNDIKEEKTNDKKEAFSFSLFKPFLKLEKSFACFAIFAFLIYFSILFLSFIQKTIEHKDEVLVENSKAYEYLKLAEKSASESDFENSIEKFDSASTSFSEAKKIIDEFGYGFAYLLNNLPLNTPVSTAKSLIQSGENISSAGKSFAEILKKASDKKSSLSLGLIPDFQPNIDNIAANLLEAKSNIENAELNYLPENIKEKIKLAKEQLPPVAENFENFSKDLPMISEMLGAKKPQKYLLLFENNSEIRAGGGFIGSYGILDIENGEIKNLFIDGIFNPDGQLKEKIVPPMPIQKISSAWSMHDANWFSDFPQSAKKVALFYEKTGGSTVDGVIAITPNVLKEMLKLTGPIPMAEYGVIINEENFLYQSQLQVEELYDKKKNNPKQFLADLAPKIIERTFDIKNLGEGEKIQKFLAFIDIAERSFKEKHLLMYHRSPEIENMIIKRGWGGKMLNSSGDYLSVVNSNINGYKTDAVIEEKIVHQAEIFADGSIVDTVKITRKHLGGNSEYDWYNRVNSDYMRVYVPLGSVLLEAKGHTVQDYEPPIDYSDFKTDPDVKKIEDTLKIDPVSGTHIFEESRKTVFGNWVYVSPQETVEVSYKYKLPFKIDFDNFTKPADRYSALIQKQIGSAGSEFTGYIKLPENWGAIWRSDNISLKNQSGTVVKTDLKTDRIYGMVFAERKVK